MQIMEKIKKEEEKRAGGVAAALICDGLNFF